ncbi:hypothetical protein [Candidatus Poriferisodalis sp.]
MPDFYEQPILNSPYEAPTRHWKLDPEAALPVQLKSALAASRPSPSS